MRRTITVRVYGAVDPGLQEKRNRQPARPIRKPYACTIKPSTAATGKDLKDIAHSRRNTVLKLAARGFA